MDDKLYAFDKVFSATTTQEEIYDHVADHVLETIRGYNTTIFAYGATGVRIDFLAFRSFKFPYELTINISQESHIQ